MEYLNFLDLYEQWEYTEILANQTLNSPEMLHNYGIAAFDRFQQEWMSDLDDLVESNKFFSWSLQKQEHTKTRYQYEFTKALLDLFSRQEQDQENQDEQNQEDSRENEQWNNPESWEDSQQWEWWQEENSDSQSQNWRDSQYFLQEWEEIKPLSAWEQRELQQSIKELKTDQLNNQQYYGKQQQLTPFEEAFDSFFWTLDRWGEKDW